MSCSRRKFLLIGATLVATPVTWARADYNTIQQDAIRRAVENGDARPLAEIVAGVRGKLPGEIVGVKIEHKRARWMYEFRVLDPSGKLFEIYVDAQNGAIERVKEK